MVVEIAGWLILVAGCWTTLKLFKLFMELRFAANKIMATSSKEFFASADSLLDSADELPDRVLDMLTTMNRYANHAHSQRALLAAVKAAENHHGKSGEKSSEVIELERIVNGMRPELRDMFRNTIVAWLLYISNRSVLVQVRMMLAILRTRARNIQAPEERMGIKLLNALPSV